MLYLENAILSIFFFFLIHFLINLLTKSKILVVYHVIVSFIIIPICIICVIVIGI